MSLYKRVRSQDFDKSSLRVQLTNGLQAMDIELDESKVDVLMAYLGLFHKWNKAYNLSAVRNPADMVVLHLLDSLSVLPFVLVNRIIDVGTGGGLPGIPLAIANPDQEWTLLDSAGKKTRFLHQVVTELGLLNVTVLNCRVEEYCPDTLYDGVISRAFASLDDMTRSCVHLLSEDGQFFAMKGRAPQDELRQIEKKYNVEQSHTLHIPNLDAERCLLVIRPKS